VNCTGVLKLMKKWVYKYFRGSTEVKISSTVHLLFLRVITGGWNSLQLFGFF